MYFHQWLSVMVQQGNAVSVVGTMAGNDGHEFWGNLIMVLLIVIFALVVVVVMMSNLALFTSLYVIYLFCFLALSCLFLLLIV